MEGMWYTKEKKKSEKLEGDSSPFTCVIYFYISLKDYLRITKEKKSKELEKIIELWIRAWFPFEIYLRSEENFTESQNCETKLWIIKGSYNIYFSEEH